MTTATKKNKKKKIDPLRFQRWMWPDIRLYREQREVLYSVRDNYVTMVPAGNMLGKDFVASIVVLWFFLCHHPVRIITTSVKDDHLDVLWGEIDSRLRTAAHPLLYGAGGPLIYNHREIRKVVNGHVDKYSYLKGQVSKKGEGLSGHHARYTLLLGDESSGLEDVVLDMCEAWAKRMLFLGNCHPCENFFKRGCQQGDIKAPNGTYYRRVIRIKGEHSPNVRLALAQQERGEKITNKQLVPGVLTHDQYVYRRNNLPLHKQCVSLDAEWYSGPELKMFPHEWLRLAALRAKELKGKTRRAKVIGCDPGEGGANTCWAVIDELGLITLRSKKTPNTADITGETIALMKQHNVSPENVLFDRGGGGKQHADRLRSQGYRVRTVAFGESVVPPKRRGTVPVKRRIEEDEERYVYVNRRAQLFGDTRLLLTPENGRSNFALSDIEESCQELHRQLLPIPLNYDSEGRVKLPPKNKRAPNSTEQTLVDLIGCSPDEADALVLAVHGMLHKPSKRTAGVL